MRRASHRPVALPLLVGLALALFVPLQATGASDLQVEQTAATAAPCETDPAAPKRQLRAEWIASVANIDWPSAPGLPAEQQRAELVGWLDDAVEDGLNAVVLQVRPTADTFWPSRLEPWSAWLTGRQGRSPGYDPLAFAVRAAHARGLQLHAWFNPYRVATTDDVSTLAPDHPARVHPRWRVAYGGQLYYDPGVPAARRHTEDVILEVVRRYDIDAVHFDDYFYPYPVGDEEFPDDWSYEHFGDGFDDRADWRRHNTDLLVQELSARIHRVKPWVTFGVSPFAVWRNASTDPEGSATEAGAQTYDDLYADTRRWVREEWLDYVAPQVYWNIGFEVADYAVLVDWWSQQVDGTGVNLYVGQATYKVGLSTQDPAWSEQDELTSHLYLNREHPQVDGDIYFSAKDVRADRLRATSRLIADHYRHPALWPVDGLRPGGVPQRPHDVSAAFSGRAVQVRWRGDAPAYAIYRYDGEAPEGWPTPCDLADATHLVGVRVTQRFGRQQFVDRSVGEGLPYTYVVTALGRSHLESGPSDPASTS